jgi:histone H3/H4
MALIVRSNIKGAVKELQKGKEEEVTSVSDEVGLALERKVEKILDDAIERAKSNKRRTLQGRDL